MEISAGFILRVYIYSVNNIFNMMQVILHFTKHIHAVEAVFCFHIRWEWGLKTNE